MNDTYKLTNFTCNDKIYILNQPVVLDLSHDEYDNFWAMNENLDITGWGTTEGDAIADAQHELELTYAFKFDSNVRSINASKLIEKIDGLIVGGLDE